MTGTNALTRDELNDLSGRVIGAAIEVHRVLGPGLLETAYEECLAHELKNARIRFARQVPLPIEYKGAQLDASYRLDLVVDRTIVVELKSIETLLPVHQAQMMTYLRLSKLPLGLLINFNVPSLRLGIKRIINQPDRTSL